MPGYLLKVIVNRYVDPALVLFYSQNMRRIRDFRYSGSLIISYISLQRKLLLNLRQQACIFHSDSQKAWSLFLWYHPGTVLLKVWLAGEDSFLCYFLRLFLKVSVHWPMMITTGWCECERKPTNDIMMSYELIWVMILYHFCYIFLLVRTNKTAGREDRRTGICLQDYLTELCKKVKQRMTMAY